MHHDPQMTSPVSLRSRRTKCLIFADISPPRNFAEFLPIELTAQIFSELDAESLCRAAQTCSLWWHIIESNQQLWKNQCLLLSCQRDVDLDRRYGLSWKLTLKRNYVRSRLKTDWLRGRYSSLRSSDELSGRKMVPLDVETWGEILEAELSR